MAESKESQDTKSSITKFVTDVLSKEETKKSPAMVAAIAELVKAYWAL
ncbi:hypothetical protein [Lacticaseibacillus sp. N501-2]